MQHPALNHALRRLYPSVSAALTSALFVIGFPPHNIAESMFVFATPWLISTTFPEGRRHLALRAFMTGAVSWAALLIWLRHVHPPAGWLGIGLLAAILGFFHGLWLWAAAIVFARVHLRPFAARCLPLLGLAAFWVLLEWLRTWLFTGFPWATLSVSQWRHPPMLQFAAWTGHFGVSFILIYFNLAVALYLLRLARSWRPAPAPALETSPEVKERRRIPQIVLRLCPEFHISLLLVFGSALLYLTELRIATETNKPLLNAAVIQPWIPVSTDPWTQGEVFEQFERLETMTRNAVSASPADQAPNLVVWHETATPLPVVSNPDFGVAQRLQQLVDEIQIPLLFGSSRYDRESSEFSNGLFLIRPDSGMDPTHYYKRKLVPFGEFIPFRSWLGWIGMVVPVGAQGVPGTKPELLSLEVPEGGETFLIGGLICYEDVFPQLARQTVAAGADVIAVVTNNAWYGTEGAAAQHAAHSVLRAVETRRSVLRCGNNGWSGWIDELGNIRQTLRGPDGSTYVRGTETFQLTRNSRFENTLSFYTRFGDWFIAVCAVLAAAGAWVTQKFLDPQAFSSFHPSPDPDL